MKICNQRKRRNLVFPFIILCLIAAVCSVTGRNIVKAWAITLSPEIYGPLKNEVVLDDNEKIDGAGRKANVLFFLDTSGVMNFSPKGKLPQVVLNAKSGTSYLKNGDGTVANWTATQATYKLTRDEVIRLLQYCTYGTGSIPFVDSSQSARRTGNINFGRDIDSDNNLKYSSGMTNWDMHPENPANRYNYYAPFLNKGHRLREDFVNQDKLDDGNTSGGATRQTYDYRYNTYVNHDDPLPYALVFKDPKYWRNGWTESRPFTDSDLMPNDSRMYMMKLVMWRLLEDTTLFENIRFGMATAYSAPLDSTYSQHLQYKVAPYGYRSNSSRYAPLHLYVNGILGTTSCGVPTDYQSYDSQYSTWGITSTAFEPSATLRERNYANRAYLRVPIADYSKVWTKVEGTKTLSMPHIEKFRLWIDGAENVSTKKDQFFFHRNPELKASALTPLAKAIFPNPKTSDENRQWYFQNKGVQYSKANDDTNVVNDLVSWSTYKYLRGSGEAAGSVLDFFSPAYDNATARGYINFDQLIDEQFPIQDLCEANWLVVFTAANDSKGGYGPAEAVRNLYNYTRDNEVTYMTKDSKTGKRTLAKGRLDKPIRTLVVGFVDPTRTDTDPVTKELVDNLNLMARAGMGVADNDESVNAYFANDVPGLLAALREIMMIINSGVQPAKGSMLEGANMEDNELAGAFNLFAATYRINRFDQWEGFLTRYESVKGKVSGDLVFKQKWELNQNLLENRARRTRNVVYWNGGSFKDLGYTVSSSDTSPHPTAEMTGMTDARIATLDTTSLPDGFGSNMHLSRALINWLYGYEVSYVDGKQHERVFMLSDLGQSGVVAVGPPPVKDGVKDYKTWAESLKKLDARVYTQSNGGILHVLKPLVASTDLPLPQIEQIAIVPPSTLLPARLPRVKIASGITGVTGPSWIDVKAYMLKKSEDIPIKSEPTYLLDGPLRKSYFYMKQITGGDMITPVWGAYLTATMGRAGNGLYMMNVTDPSAPKFYWYRETLDNKDGTITLLRMDATMNEPEVKTEIMDSSKWASITSETTADSYPFYQLGFNSPKPATGMADVSNGAAEPVLQNMIVLPGGMQRSLDLNNNGKMGAALYVIDPDINKHNAFGISGAVQVFNSGKVDSAWRVGSDTTGKAPYMGMMVSEPTLLPSKQNEHYVDKIFAADNRGNIFMLSLRDDVTGNSLPVNSWTLRTIATIRSKSEAGTSDSYSIPYGIVVNNKNDNVFWAAGGTSNVGTRDNDSGKFANDPQLLRNKRQMLFCFNVSTDLAGGQTLFRDGMELKTADDITPLPDGKRGWYMELEREDNTGVYGEEYVSTQPAFLGGILYASTFIPQYVSTKGNELTCDSGRITGKSRLYAMFMESGAPARWQKRGKKYLELEGIKITGFTHSTEGDVQTLLITYDVLNQEAADRSIEEALKNEPTLTKAPNVNLLSLLSEKLGFNKRDLNFDDSVILYWLSN